MGSHTASDTVLGSRPARRRHAALLATLAVVIGLLLPASIPNSAATAATTSTSPTVGAIFQSGSSSHDCTGSVIASSSGDLVLTAAHCVSGTGAGITFVPGYNGTAPYGTWTVTAAHAAAGWITSQDPNDDMVVLTVASQTIDGVTRTLQSVVGAEQIGATASSGTTVTAYGYPSGTGTAPVSCTTTTTTTASSIGDVATVDCAGFVGGTSGGPWLEQTSAGTTLVGIVGGLHQGGCSADISYSPTFNDTLTALVTAADDGTAGNTLPTAGSDGC